MDEFRRYIEDKYKGKEVVSSKNETLTVRTIADLNFKNLDVSDQYEALDNDWAWGLSEEVRGKTILHAFLFRPTQRDFLLSGRRFNALVGGLGTGKTFALGLKTVIMIFKHPGINFVWYRKTIPQMKSTTLRQLLEDVLPGLGMREGEHWKHHADPTQRYVSIIVGDKESKIFYRPYKEQGIAHDVMVDDIKSFNIDAIGIDEPNTLGLDTYEMIEGRTGRWTDDLAEELQQVNITGNPPAQHHWLNYMYGQGRDPKNPDKKMENAHEYKIWYMSTYDNRDGVARKYLEQLEAKSEEWKRTYLYGLPGFTEHSGAPIFQKSFVEERHIVYTGIEVDSKLPLVLGWDISSTGVDKACVICQVDKDGCFNVLDEVVSDNAGLPDFVGLVKQRIATFWQTEVRHIRSYADPIAWVEEQISLMTPSTLLARAGFPSQKGAKNLPGRLSAVTKLLTQDANNGKPGIQINYDNCPVLIQGFFGGYKYKTVDESDRIFSALPVKNVYSHIHDALQYAASGVIRVFEAGLKPEITEKNYRQPAFANPNGTENKDMYNHLPKRMRPRNLKSYHSPLSRSRRSSSPRF